MKREDDSHLRSMEREEVVERSPMSHLSSTAMFYQFRREEIPRVRGAQVQ
jgi:hypothetical protein